MIKDKLPLFSIVIPTYNHGHLIHRCLESVLAQTYKNWEAIIINNFSTDKTVDVVSNYKDPRIRLINFANEGVIAASRNKGILEAKGEWICFLDSDDWWVNEKLAECIPFLNDFDLIYHSMYTMPNKKKLKGRSLNRVDIHLDMLMNGNALINSSVVVRRAIIDKVGLIDQDPNFIAVEDFDLWLRISLITSKFYFINKFLGYYWCGGGNISISDRQICRMQFVYQKHLEHYSDEVVDEVLLRLAYLQARLLQQLGLKFEAVQKFNIAMKSNSFIIRTKALVFKIVLKFY